MPKRNDLIMSTVNQQQMTLDVLNNLEQIKLVILEESVHS